VCGVVWHDWCYRGVDVLGSCVVCCVFVFFEDGVCHCVGFVCVERFVYGVTMVFCVCVWCGGW